MDIRCCLLLLVALLLPAHAASANDEPFPRPEVLEPDVRFWTRVYTEVDTNGGFIHDHSHLGVVYEVLSFAPDDSKRKRRKKVENAKKRYRKILRTLASGRRTSLNAEQRRVLALWPQDISNRELKAAARRLRFQLGQADKFRAGLIRAGAWEEHIRATLREHGLPEGLAALPHVESSYNPRAHSHRGASGLWQFTRSTGRRYLRIDRAVDERRDPFASTVAAARLLKHNYAATGTWPLAITAYNHGSAGVRRAKRKIGSDDIAVIVRRYSSRRFGFASRNFYVAFLAALHVSENAEQYFGALREHAPVAVETVKLDAYFPAAELARSLGVELERLREFNPALRRTVWKGAQRIPRGYVLRVPLDETRERSAATIIAGMTSEHRHAAQAREREYVVERGNTLSSIATQFGVSVSELADINELRSRHFIRAGQVLRLPAPYGETARPRTVQRRTVPADGLYTVQPGDSLSLIALQFGTDIDTLQQLNALSGRDLIYSGQTLVVTPGGDTSDLSPASSTAAADTGTTVVALAEAGSAPSDDGVPPPHVRGAETVATAAPAPDPTAAPDPPAVPPTAPAPELDAKRAPAEREAEAHTEHELEDIAIALLESSEPASASEAHELGAAQPPGAHPALSADPSDYSVADDGTVEVQIPETLGHYADWLGLRAQHLRNLNGLRFGQPVIMGERLKLDFTHVSPESFEERRRGFHIALQEAFFSEYRIAGTHEHRIAAGDSLWLLANYTYRVPVWLLRQYNPDLEFGNVRPGTRMVVPLLERLDTDDAPPAPALSAG